MADKIRLGSLELDFDRDILQRKEEFLRLIQGKPNTLLGPCCGIFIEPLKRKVANIAQKRIREKQKEIDAKQREKDAVLSRIADLKTQLTSIQDQIQQKEGEATQMEVEVAKLEEQKNELQQFLS